MLEVQHEEWIIHLFGQSFIQQILTEQWLRQTRIFLSQNVHSEGGGGREQEKRWRKKGKEKREWGRRKKRRKKRKKLEIGHDKIIYTTNIDRLQIRVLSKADY